MTESPVPPAWARRLTNDSQRRRDPGRSVPKIPTCASRWSTAKILGTVLAALTVVAPLIMIAVFAAMTIIITYRDSIIL